MTDLVNLATRNGTRVAVSSAVATSWANSATDSIRVRLACDVATHVRVVKNNTDEATEADYPLFPDESIVLDVAKAEHLSFLGYREVAGTKESGTITFAAVASGAKNPSPANAVPDSVTVNDGVKTAVVFTFGDGTAGTLLPGATAAASAEVLRAAIQTKITATLLDVTVMRFGAVLQIVNQNYVGGAITIGAGDADGDSTPDEASRISRVQFSGGASPGSPPLHTGSVWVNQV